MLRNRSFVEAVDPVSFPVDLFARVDHGVHRANALAAEDTERRS